MTLQDIIHYIEVGAGKRFLRITLILLAVLGVAFLHDIRSWTNFSTEEAMDSAQLARNIADGKGYTTSFVRPLSLYLVQQKNQGKPGLISPDGTPDYAQVKGMHPDLANPPVYPVLLAGLMKITPFRYGINLNSSFWTNDGRFWRYQPDFMIGGVFDPLIFLAAIAVAFFIARKLFDIKVAQLAAFLLLGCSLLWRFSASGLSTMLLILIFLVLAWCVLKVEELARGPEPDTNQILVWSAGAGILTGIGALTRYSFGWLIIPLLLFILLFSGPKKLFNVVVALLAFSIVLAPWIIRNMSVCGAPFGTAGYAIFSGAATPEPELERALHPQFVQMLWPTPYFHKLSVNLSAIFEDGLFKLGGSWVSPLFFAGLLLGFNRSAVRRMRYFLLMCLGTLMVVQALGRTSLSDDSPEINSENLLILVVPLVFIYGTAFFYILLDQMDLPIKELRYVVISVFTFLCYLPLIFSLWFKASPVSYPPYFPPDVVKAAGWMRPNELMMSDVPWAVAWYGQRQCVWLTENASDDFYAVNDYLKPVSGLYLTLRAMDGRLVSDCFRSGNDSWGHFVLHALAQNEIPSGFPLRHSPAGSAAISSGLFLTDSDRWKIGGNSNP